MAVLSDALLSGEAAKALPNERHVVNTLEVLPKVSSFLRYFKPICSTICKGKPHLKLSILILNYTVRKN